VARLRAASVGSPLQVFEFLAESHKRCAKRCYRTLSRDRFVVEFGDCPLKLDSRGNNQGQKFRD